MSVQPEKLGIHLPCPSVRKGSSQIRQLANIMIALLSCWAIYVIVASLFDVTILFPFRVIDVESVPYYRLYSLRLAIIGTFAFYGIKHLVRGSSAVYPIHYLKTFLFFLSVVSGTLGLLNPEWISAREWGLVALFFWVAITLQIASSSKHRRYFRHR